MTDPYIFRLRELLVAAIAEIDAMEGAAPAPVAGERLFDRQPVTVGELARRLRCSEKTARRIGVEANARFQVGGRIYFDLAAVERHVDSSVLSRDLPSLAVSPELASCDDSSIE
jgi:hypothetical protein